MIAALMAQREERPARSENIQPLLWATLFSQRGEQQEGGKTASENVLPAVIAALMAQREERQTHSENIQPLLLASLFSLVVGSSKRAAKPPVKTFSRSSGLPCCLAVASTKHAESPFSH